MRVARFWRMKQNMYRLEGVQDDETNTLQITTRVIEAAKNEDGDAAHEATALVRNEADAA